MSAHRALVSHRSGGRGADTALAVLGLLVRASARPWRCLFAYQSPHALRLINKTMNLAALDQRLAPEAALAFASAFDPSTMNSRGLSLRQTRLSIRPIRHSQRTTPTCVCCRYHLPPRGQPLCL